jgi:hypothetical protein
MTRVALCLSGQPRCYRDTFLFIYHNIIQPNQADVFFHTWFDESNLYMEKAHIGRGDCNLPATTIQELVELYKPKAYLVEKPKEFKKPNLLMNEKRIQSFKEMNSHRNFTDEQSKDFSIKHKMSMLYSIFKSNELKESYANENGIVYDYVIRLRFDCIPKVPIHLSQFDPNVLYYQDLAHPDSLISDWINFGSNLIMNVFSTQYFHIEYYNSIRFYPLSERLPNTLEPCDTSGGWAEYMVRDVITFHKIPHKPMQLHCILHPKA